MGTLASLALVALVGVGIRLVAMFAIQQRRERVNRQINERLRTLIAAYKTLGGSFTGELAVDPTHLRDLRRRPAADPGGSAPLLDLGRDGDTGSDRARRVRDAVEAALSDIILLGTERQVELAARAARDLVAGQPVHMHDLVIALRDFIRDALDLDPVPSSLALPRQGPARPAGGGGGGRGGRAADSGREGGRQGGAGGGGGMAMEGDMGGGTGTHGEADNQGGASH